MGFFRDKEPKVGDVEEQGYFPETQALIDLVKANPKHPFSCSHGDGDGAVGIYEVPKGCVALPGIETQTLCPHHRWSNGSFEGMHLVVDLSIDGGWSKRFREKPDFYIEPHAETGDLELVRFADRPFEIP